MTAPNVTPLMVMIPILNRWLAESVEPAVDCAEALLEALAEAGFTLAGCWGCCAHCGYCEVAGGHTSPCDAGCSRPQLVASNPP